MREPRAYDGADGGKSRELSEGDGRVEGAACESAVTGQPLLTDDCPLMSFTVTRPFTERLVSHSLVTQCFHHRTIWVFYKSNAGPDVQSYASSGPRVRYVGQMDDSRWRTTSNKLR